MAPAQRWRRDHHQLWQGTAAGGARLPLGKPAAPVVAATSHQIAAWAALQPLAGVLRHVVENARRPPEQGLAPTHVNATWWQAWAVKRHEGECHQRLRPTRRGCWCIGVSVANLLVEGSTLGIFTIAGGIKLDPLRNNCCWYSSGGPAFG
ncbi:hypothetical protein Vretimale_2609 [Volvox reticuliferus]|uniref:Uncharacterized protein n=1 Tax=Volvox reticuliferus TaxID=1737510 RepID=A0A8J4DCG5_9CHLO|nr:hypothetical protein Vretimale_2609 [Volvox reticuliferus]